MKSFNTIKKLILIVLIFVATSLNAFAMEHTVVYVRDIEIVGLNAVKPEFLLDKIQSKAGYEYNRDYIQTDLKTIYQTGFFTDKMKAIPVENKDNTITLKIFVEENIPITGFTIEGNNVVSTEEILSYLLPLKGLPQNITNINEAIDKIQNCYASKGYILAKITNFTDDPDGMINITINEGIINKIMIKGNEKTKKYVIERNIMSEAGVVYNDNVIKEDLVRLYATQAFKDVNREIEASPEDPTKYDVTIVVKEQRTAVLAIGGGIDSATGLFGSVGISDNNFRGLNQRISLNGMIGSGVMMNDATVKDHMNIQAELSFFEPYFFNADTSLMNKVYFRDFGSYQVPLAIEQRYGYEGTVSHRLKQNPNLSTTFSLGVENVNVKEGDIKEIRKMYAKRGLDIAERSKQLEGGLFLGLGPGLVYDTRDSGLNPRNGVLANVKFDEEIGLNNFKNTHGKLTGMVKKYVPVMKKSALSFTAKGGGKIHGEMPEVMAYRLGGPYTIRGFKMSGVGTGDAFVMGSAELITPLFFLDRIKKMPFLDNVKFTMFVDAGKMFQPTISDKLYDRPTQAVTAGVGMKIYIPGVGPLSVDYGIPITNPGSYGSKNGYFTFGVGNLLY